MAAPSTLMAPQVQVLADLVPTFRISARTRDAALVLSGALLTALLAQVAFHIPPSPVPVTGQTLAVVLVGATLGAGRGMAAMVLYVVLGLFLPFYSEGASGPEVVWGPSGGYLIGFIVAAGVIGRLAEHAADRRTGRAFATFVIGQLCIFAFGLAGLKLAVGESWSWTIHNGFTIFIVGGLMKAAIGAAVLPSAWQLVRRADRRS
jgi:biotin transport system substrate-specific component